MLFDLSASLPASAVGLRFHTRSVFDLISRPKYRFFQLDVKSPGSAISLSSLYKFDRRSAVGSGLAGESGVKAAAEKSAAEPDDGNDGAADWLCDAAADSSSLSLPSSACSPLALSLR